MHIVLRFVLEHAAVDWAAAQSHHLLHQHLQTNSRTNQLSEHLLQQFGWVVLALVSSFIASNMYCSATSSSPKGSNLNWNRKNVLEYVSILKWSRRIQFFERICVFERERECVCMLEGQRKRERERVSECVCESVCVWVCVSVCLWDRERELVCVWVSVCMGVCVCLSVCVLVR